MRLLLIRHGQTPSNVLGLLDTAVPGPGLTALGQQQAAALPGTLLDDRIDTIFASTQQRAQLTAAPIAAARGLQVQIRAGLREIGAGDLEMLGDDRSVRTYQQTIRRWMVGELDLTMPGGPSGAEVLARFDDVVSEVIDQLRASVGAAGAAVVVAHGAILRLWATVRASDLAEMEGALGRAHSLQNTGMIVVEQLTDGGWQLISWAGRPIGGARLQDETAEDPTGEDY
ncbi:MAG: histidine phosphatase family protein [Nakamurella sp.]